MSFETAPRALPTFGRCRALGDLSSIERMVILLKRKEIADDSCVHRKKKKNIVEINICSL